MQSQQGQSVTVPLHLEHNRPFVDLRLQSSTGERETARFLVDTGASGITVSEPLAQSVGLQFEFASEREYYAEAHGISAMLQDLPLDLGRATTLVRRGGSASLGTSAQGMVGTHVLSRYRVAFDYLGRLFTLSNTSTQPPLEANVESAMQSSSNFFRVEVEIEGEAYGMLLATGASYTMASRRVIEGWQASYPDWRSAIGAAGAANMGLQDDAEALMVRVPELQWRDYHLRNVGVVSRPGGMFEDTFSQWMTKPIVGALAGNVLREFKLEIDYGVSQVSIERAASQPENDMDLVGIILGTNADAGYFVTGICSQAASEVREAAHIGDKLLAVDEQEISGLPFGNVIDMLRGEVGQTHKLKLLRNREILNTEAPVTSLL